MAKLVSKTYGDALFEVALESGRMDEFRDEAVAVKAALNENPELFKLMSRRHICRKDFRGVCWTAPPDCRKRSFCKSGYGAGLFH